MSWERATKIEGTITTVARAIEFDSINEGERTNDKRTNDNESAIELAWAISYD
jgi:hypothetical protein